MSRYFQPLAVANEFIKRAAPQGLTHMKLQKLVFMAHGWWLERHNHTFLSEQPEVWQYGPVFSGLYHDLKHNGSSLIIEPQEMAFGVPPKVEDQEVEAVLDHVWATYKNTSAVQLSDITHRPGTPWHSVAKRHDFKVPVGTEIPEDIVRNYYRAFSPDLAGR